MEKYLDLFKWDFKAKGLVVIRVEGVLLDCRLLLLQPLAVLHQVDLHIRICRGKAKNKIVTLLLKLKQRQLLEEHKLTSCCSEHAELSNPATRQCFAEKVCMLPEHLFGVLFIAM